MHDDKQPTTDTRATADTRAMTDTQVTADKQPTTHTQPTKPELLESLRRLSDDELVARVKSLAARERRATALLVAHLAELDTRDLHLRAGYPSLFNYCRDVLALSDHEAYNRMEVAHTARRFPLVLDLLASGAVNLTTVRLLGPHLTAENHRSVLESARGKRKAEVEEIVVRLAPRPDVPASVRKLPARSVAAGAAIDSCSPGGNSCSPGADSCSPGADSCSRAGGPRSPAARSCPGGVDSRPPGADSPSAGAASFAPPDDAGPTPAASSPSATGCRCGVAEQASPACAPRRQASHEASAALTPLSPDRYRYQLTIGGATLEKLRLAKDMLRHAVPSGDDEALLDRALTLLLCDLAKKKFGAKESARTSPRGAKDPHDVRREAAKDSRDIPVAVKRAVWVRDLGRCAFVAEDGRRCGERAFLEFHHLLPVAAGGEATVSNIQLRCRSHHGYETRRFFPRPEDRAFVLERNGSVAAVPSSRVTGSTAKSPTGSTRSTRAWGGTARADRGVARAPRQAMLP